MFGVEAETSRLYSTIHVLVCDQKGYYDIALCDYLMLEKKGEAKARSMVLKQLPMPRHLSIVMDDQTSFLSNILLDRSLFTRCRLWF